MRTVRLKAHGLHRGVYALRWGGRRRGGVTRPLFRERRRMQQSALLLPKLSQGRQELDEGTSRSGRGQGVASNHRLHYELPAPLSPGGHGPDLRRATLADGFAAFSSIRALWEIHPVYEVSSFPDTTHTRGAWWERARRQPAPTTLYCGVGRRGSPGESQTTRSFQRPRRNSSVLTRASVEYATVIERNTPKGPNPRTRAS